MLVLKFLMLQVTISFYNILSQILIATDDRMKPKYLGQAEKLYKKVSISQLATKEL